MISSTRVVQYHRENFDNALGRMMGGSTPGTSSNRKSRPSRACTNISPHKAHIGKQLAKDDSGNSCRETRSRARGDDSQRASKERSDAPLEPNGTQTQQIDSCNDHTNTRRVSKRVRRAPVAIYTSIYAAQGSSPSNEALEEKEHGIKPNLEQPQNLRSTTGAEIESNEDELREQFIVTTVPYPTGASDVYDWSSGAAGRSRVKQTAPVSFPGNRSQAIENDAVPTPEFRVVCELNAGGHPVKLPQTQHPVKQSAGKRKKGTGETAREEDLSDQRFQRRHYTTEVIERKRKKWGSYTTRFELLQNMRRIELEEKERREQKAILNVLPPKVDAEVDVPPPPPPPFSFWPVVDAEDVSSHAKLNVEVGDTLPVVAFGCAVPDLCSQSCDFSLPDSGVNAIIVNSAKS